MNEPKKLIGRDLLRHAKELEEHLEAGGEVEYWFGGAFSVMASPAFDEALWKYRKKPEPTFKYLNIYPSMSTPGRFYSGGVYSKRSDADMMATEKRVSRMKVELKAGVWDE